MLTLARNSAQLRLTNGLRYAQLSSAAVSQKEKLFDKILIANRGEIACRVMRTCKKLNIKTVAVHSDVDSYALHARMADERFEVGGAQSRLSYLNIDKICDVIKQTGTQAVHPGYGFLSENSVFAERLESMGVEFIGPRQHAIHVMGDKVESKITAKAAGVHIIPGFNGIITDVDHAIKVANEIGYPVMIKASAGGGGKGMRIAWNDKETRDGYRFAKDEAKSSFGDDRLLIEKYIDNPRHIEIQVLCDKFGNGVYLNERECSIQRRNQKVIEEAPSSFLDPETRRAMGEQAVALAKAVQYESAGTVEFLVDSKRNFYFLEMNTRLQVEHPITEKITGVDIVEQMIRVAAGHPLPFKQKDIGINGWAIESRVYAEDPYTYLPATGKLTTYIEPTVQNPLLPGVRCDSGVYEGGEISVFYDPMIAKLVTHGKNREDAIEQMKVALDSYVIKGLTHNIPLLRDILRQPRFVSGDISTKFLPEVYPKGFQGYQLNDEETRRLIGGAAYMYIKRQRQNQMFENTSSSNVNGIFYDKDLAVTLNDKVYNIKVHLADNGALEVSFTGDDGKTISLPISADWELGASLFTADIAGHHTIIQFVERRGQNLRLRFCGTEFDLVVRNKEQQEYFSHIPEKKKEDKSLSVLSPMPGVLVSVAVKVGQKVAEGAEVAVVEAMKMQNQLLAPRSGVIKSVNFKAGDTVSKGAVILEFEKEDN